MMDQRYGAYAWLLALFRLIFDGGGHAGLRLPTRHGQLFNPDEFPFLEGRPLGVGRVVGEKFEAPRVSDGCIYRVLDALLLLDGERLSYRALDVEQVGSVYEAMMGYAVERASGRCIAVRPKHVVVDMGALLEVDGAKRVKWLKDQADSDLTGASATALKTAATPEEVVAALGRRVSPRSLDATGTPRLMAPGTLYLQPGEERRRTGSHYTPRELTEPIVRTTLRPVLEALGERPTPGQILDLKVCDPAMGSGAFLVEACRQLADCLVTAWDVHGAMPEMGPDEEPLLHARRLVAQQCLYGVDKNPFAVSLAKLSLWLVTLARDHAFTFIDHALKHGDSLVGLTREQITAFHWKTQASDQIDWIAEQTRQDIEEALRWRNTLQELHEGDYNQKKKAWWEAEDALADARRIGDLVVAAFFGASKDSAREELRGQYLGKVEAWRANAATRHDLQNIEPTSGGGRPVPPMHWEIEFPEVFGRENPGFDAMVGNPPFLGGRRISTVLGPQYLGWLLLLNPGAGNLCDLVGHFFRRAFGLIRLDGMSGLVGTKTIAEGDTRVGGLEWLVGAGATIFSANRRLKWPGRATVIVSVVQYRRGAFEGPRYLDGQVAARISAFLLDGDADRAPRRLAGRNALFSKGCQIYGQGFLFDDGDTKATPVAALERIRREEPQSYARIHPYIGGSQVNSSPDLSVNRWAINVSDLDSKEALESFPALSAIIRSRVKPERDALPDRPSNRPLKRRWWAYQAHRPALERATRRMDRVLVGSQVTAHIAFVFQPTDRIFSQKLNVFLFQFYWEFAVMQSTVHIGFARRFTSTLGETINYSATDCFETFPFPESSQADPTCELSGKNYHEFRADLMVRNDEGLTKTYNRFHDPNETDPDMQQLRELHAAMDRVVLDAYGWTDIPTDCKFLLDYDIDEETWGKKKKPYRYRWPEEVHNEVLARLLDLNRERYAEEVAAGLHAEKGTRGAASKKKTRRQAALSTSNVALPLD